MHCIHVNKLLLFVQGDGIFAELWSVLRGVPL